MLSLGFLIALQRSKGWTKQKQYDTIAKIMKKDSMQTCVQQLGVWPLPSIAVKVAKVESCERQVLRIAQWGHYDGSWNLMYTNKTPTWNTVGCVSEPKVVIMARQWSKITLVLKEKTRGVISCATYLYMN
jgi:hypothetical protein